MSQSHARPVFALQKACGGASRLHVSSAVIALLLRVAFDHVVRHGGLVGFGGRGSLRLVRDGIALERIGKPLRQQRVARIQIGDARQRAFIE